MRVAVLAVAFSSVVTVAQHDAQRSNVDPPSVSVSSDGRYVALVSYDRLAPADTNVGRDIYVLDRVSRSVVLESLPLDGSARAEDCDHPALSGDGRFLVYETQGRIVWRDRLEGVATILGEGREPSISGDGAFVAYTTGSGVALSGVFSHTLQRISVGLSGPGAGFAPNVSGDGRYVAFTSTGELAPTTRPPVSKVYVRDVEQQVTRLVSVGVSAARADGDSWAPALSADGHSIAFVSAATNLVSGDRNGAADVFIADLASGSIGLVSRNWKGAPGNGRSGTPAISANGRFVAFQSEASDLVRPSDDFNLLWDVFLFDRETRRVAWLSTDSDGPWMEASGGPAIDAAGEVVAFSSRHPTDPADSRNDFDLFVLTLK